MEPWEAVYTVQPALVNFKVGLLPGGWQSCSRVSLSYCLGLIPKMIPSRGRLCFPAQKGPTWCLGTSSSLLLTPARADKRQLLEEGLEQEQTALKTLLSLGGWGGKRTGQHPLGGVQDCHLARKPLYLTTTTPSLGLAKRL